MRTLEDLGAMAFRGFVLLDIAHQNVEQLAHRPKVSSSLL